MVDTERNIGSNGNAWNPARSGEIVRALTQDINSGAVLTRQTLEAAHQVLAEQSVTVETGVVPDRENPLWQPLRTVVLFENISPARRHEVTDGNGLLIDVNGQTFSVGKV